MTVEEHAENSGMQTHRSQQQQQPPAEGQAASIMRQTAVALGLWEQLHETASTPSTVLSPQSARRLTQTPAASASTDLSAA
jgi:hypothetical protein